jgi:hypothetical protein
MNSIHNNGENDKSLSEGLDKLSRKYGLLEQDEPPELLDQAILNSAHRAVEKKPHWMKFGWLHGLTTAAVFVLAFSIILNQRENAPDFDTSMRSNEPVRLNRQKVAKKQSDAQFEERPKELGLEREEKSDSSLDILQSSPVATAPASAAIEHTPEDRAREPVAEVQRSLYVSDDMQGKGERSDKGTPAKELILEEELMNEADSMADSPEAGAFSTMPRPAVLGETATSEAKAQVKTDLELEQRLLAIIKLKQSGNETWKTELESFKESYPDYPLPDELTD